MAVSFNDGVIPEFQGRFGDAYTWKSQERKKKVGSRFVWAHQEIYESLLNRNVKQRKRDFRTAQKSL